MERNKTLTFDQVAWAECTVADEIRFHAITGTSDKADKQVAQALRAIRAAEGNDAVQCGNTWYTRIHTTEYVIGLKRS